MKCKMDFLFVLNDGKIDVVLFVVGVGFLVGGIEVLINFVSNLFKLINVFFIIV